MNITASQVNELRQMTGAGMMDCKKALVETDGDIQAAIDILRKKGMAKAAKRADRNASEGCVLSKATEDHKYAAIIMVNCETDFVANNADFVKFTKDVLDMAVANRVKDIEALKAMSSTARPLRPSSPTRAPSPVRRPNLVLSKSSKVLMWPTTTTLATASPPSLR